MLVSDVLKHNDERMHHYQRRRASIPGLVLWLLEIIETERLVVVVMTRLVVLLPYSSHAPASFMY